MIDVVGVSFRRAGKIYYFDPDGVEYSKGTYVIVETIRGVEIGRISMELKKIDDPEGDTEIKKILRPANREDLLIRYRNKLRAHRALKICKRKIKEYELAMKLVEVEYAHDESKIIFYFSADGRIDFRNLVRELAAIFKKRIELHQIGVRDEAKILGAIGLCGRPVCCSLFMPEFVPVSIKMAKEQSLSLNPERISGVCGRFMCCLKHEYDVYHEALKTFPAVGSFIDTPQGKLRVIEQCIAKDSVIVETLEQERLEVKMFPSEQDKEAQTQEQGSEAVEMKPEIKPQKQLQRHRESPPRQRQGTQPSSTAVSEEKASVPQSDSMRRNDAPHRPQRQDEPQQKTEKPTRQQQQQQPKPAGKNTQTNKPKIKISPLLLETKFAGSWNGAPRVFDTEKSEKIAEPAEQHAEPVNNTEKPEKSEKPEKPEKSEKPVGNQSSNTSWKKHKRNKKANKPKQEEQ